MKPLKFKESDLVDTIGRGVKTDTCKLCGSKIGDLAQHLKWHDALNSVLHQRG